MSLTIFNSFLNLSEAQAIVAVAHQRRTMVSAHVLVSEDLEHALNVGVDDSRVILLLKA